MNVIALVSSLLHIGLLVVVYLVIPYAVPPDREEEIKNWVLASFSAIFLLLITVSAREKVNVFVIVLVGVIVISGLVWWVPSYVPKEDQDLVSHLLIISSSIFITIVSAIFSLGEAETIGAQQTGSLEGIIGGLRRRRR
jgi:hypothetical protein